MQAAARHGGIAEKARPAPRDTDTCYIRITQMETEQEGAYGAGGKSWADPLKAMSAKTQFVEAHVEKSWPVRYHLRTPAEPSPAPIKEPPNPPDNPDAPVREPDPDDPQQI
jgi:hypothetical protein